MAGPGRAQWGSIQWRLRLPAECQTFHFVLFMGSKAQNGILQPWQGRAGVLATLGSFVHYRVRDLGVEVLKALRAE